MDTDNIILSLTCRQTNLFLDYAGENTMSNGQTAERVDLSGPEQLWARHAYWKNLTLIRTAWQHQCQLLGTGEPDNEGLIEYCILTHGFKPLMRDDGYYTPEYHIVDPAQYVIFLLKFSQ
jgi:hypothetical protein